MNRVKSMRSRILLLSVFVIFGLFLSSCANNAREAVEADFAQAEALYGNGIYEGKGTGYGRGLKVSVTVTDGRISDIQIISHNEVGKQYYEEAFETIPQRVIEAQNTEVDAVSGATKTSNGIKQAVENALLDAKSTDE